MKLQYSNKPLTCKVYFRVGVFGCRTTNIFSWDPQMSYKKHIFYTQCLNFFKYKNLQQLNKE
jgi:hypothetical protein